MPLAVSAADYNQDGKVDLYLSMFVNAEKFRSPVYNDKEHAKSNVLLRNLGNLQFEEVSQAAGLQNTFTSSFVDLNQDGFPELVLAQNTGQVEILRNVKGVRFERVTLIAAMDFGWDLEWRISITTMISIYF